MAQFDGMAQFDSREGWHSLIVERDGTVCREGWHNLNIERDGSLIVERDGTV